MYVFPRLNNISFWLMIPSFILYIISNFIEEGASVGWTMYAPLIGKQYNSSIAIEAMIFSLHCAPFNIFFRSCRVYLILNKTRIQPI